LAQPGDQGLFSMSLATLADGRVVLSYSSETGDATNVTTLDYRIIDPRDSTISGTAQNDTILGRADASHVSASTATTSSRARPQRHARWRERVDTLSGGDGGDALLAGPATTWSSRSRKRPRLCGRRTRLDFGDAGDDTLSAVSP